MADRLVPPAGTVVVRMYRIGHGDCFLLACPGTTADKPVYVLIDCGYKPGSPKFIKTTAKEITDDIREATGGHIDVAIITHEHQDHVNGISKTNFKDITIGEAWFAWTEDPDDEVANDLRTEFKDKLLGLLAARNRLQADGDAEIVTKLDRFLAFELGGDDETFNAAAALTLLAADDPLNSMNKKSMKLFKDRASKGSKFLRPHSAIRKVPGADGIRVFVLGPPRNLEQLKSLDPEGDEEFHLAMSSPMAYFGAAARATDGERSPQIPFAPRYCVQLPVAIGAQPEAGEALPLFVTHYGKPTDPPLAPAPERPLEVPTNADWRRIDRDWLYSAEQLALDMGDYTNNSSLVLAFELGQGGKVLLFAADAQRGNWKSWTKKGWTDGGTQVTTKDLLARTVLYKVGHHGSHNGTLNGAADADYANISWMAEGDHGREFTAMITAVRKWAETQDGWDHPLKAIKDALLQKAGGRVFQTDTDFDAMKKPSGATTAEWDQFKGRTVGAKLYFDYTISIS
jgi:beta-lactamase superfamily II metal-dependent hydrolase